MRALWYFAGTLQEVLTAKDLTPVSPIRALRDTNLELCLSTADASGGESGTIISSPKYSLSPGGPGSGTAASVAMSVGCWIAGNTLAIGRE